MRDEVVYLSFEMTSTDMVELKYYGSENTGKMFSCTIHPTCVQEIEASEREHGYSARSTTNYRAASSDLSEADTSPKSTTCAFPLPHYVERGTKAPTVCGQG